MLNNTTRKTINIDKTNLISLWTFKQEDDGVILLSLFKNSMALDITGQTVKLGIKRPNGTLVSIEASEADNPFTIVSNNLDIKLKNSALAIPGLLECDLELVDVNGKMTTASFFITVSKKVVGETNIAATNEIPILEKLKSDFQTDVNNIKAEYDSFKGAQLEADKVTYFQNEVNKTNAHIAENTQQIEQLKSDIGTTANIEELKAVNNEATQKMVELDSKINQVGDISNTIENVEDAKKDFNGNIKSSLSERLASDMSYVNNRFNNASLLEYDNKYITANESYDGITRELKVKGRAIKNLLGDAGNCEALNKWTQVIDVSIDNSVKLFGTGSIKFIGSRKELRKNILCDQTHKYFVSVNAYITNYVLGRLSLGLWDYNSWTNPTWKYFDMTKLNTWQRNSEIITGKANSGFKLQISSGTDGDFTANVDGVMVYDLTEIYGAGKEPTDIVKLEAELPFVEGIKSVGEEGTIEISSVGKNLINLNDITFLKGGATELVEKNSNSIMVRSNVAQLFGHMYGTFKAGVFKPNTNYRLSFKSESNRVDVGKCIAIRIFKDNNFNSVVAYNNGKNTFLFTTPASIKGLGIAFYTNISDNSEAAYTLNKYYDIQIEEVVQIDDPGTTYEPYKEDKISISLNEPLRALPNGVTDEIDLGNGKLIRRVPKYVTTGLEVIAKVDISSNTTKDATYAIFEIRANLPIKGTAYDVKQTAIMCDNLSYGYSRKELVELLIEGVCFVGNGLYVSILKSRLSTPDTTGFKSWLQSNPVTVYYELATSSETPVDITNNLRTYDNVTNIFTVGSLIEPDIYCKVPSDVITALDTRQSTVKGKLFGSADARLEEIEQDIINITIQEGWLTPTLLNGWTNLDEVNFNKVGYRKDKFNVVHLKGIIKGTVTLAMFNLPVGYRPIKKIYLPLVSNMANGVLEIGVNGDVICKLGNNAWVSLDGLVFQII